MRILDLYSGGGCGALGMMQAGHTVTGVDIEPLGWSYPGTFIQGDALAIDPQWARDNFDAIWSSPPCQKYSHATSARTKARHPDSIPPTRELLDRIGLPYVIENVPGAPVRHDLMLCGSMFPECKRLVRHRYFEISRFSVPVMECGQHPWRAITIMSHSSRPAATREEWLAAFGMSNGHLSVMGRGIPPAYARYITSHLP